MSDLQHHGTPHTARVLGAWMLILAAPLHACPICDTGTGQQVRAGIFDENFWGTFIAVIAPFPVLLLVIATYHFGFPGLRNRSAPASTHNEHHESQHQ